MEENKGTKLKEMDLSNLEFKANGKDYFIEAHVSAERFAKMQEIEFELGFGVTYRRLFDELGEAEDYMNELKLVDAAVIIRRIREGIGGLESRKHTIFQYCACFINTKDEDRRVYDENIMNEKIKDWEEEGFDYRSFFRLAANMVGGLKENYKKFTQSISEQKMTTEM